MAKPEKIEFMVIARDRMETAKGEVYSVKLQSKGGHRLILKAETSAIYNGYGIGDKVTITISKEQTTLVK